MPAPLTPGEFEDVDRPSHEAIALLVGEQLGAYRVERLIGRGGMGAVFLGARADGEFPQTVAIKTIQAGLEREEGLERFRRERDILARLDHPGIARLLDGGTGPRGVPFVVMEYVEGEPIVAYVTRRQLSVRQAIELFLELCDAIEFVHRHLVVHRDLKPANVLVTSDGRIKLLDFGIATLTEDLDPDARSTAASQRPMTPEYASPEQILGRPVTTATDVYALGALLYELLTGQRAMRSDSSNPFELAQEIVGRDPTAPSEVLRRAAREPGGSRAVQRKVARQLRGDLDRIVLMAMHKEPERRYPSVAAFSADLRAWLGGRRVQARRDTWPYRVRKFVGRHPFASAASAGFLAVLMAFTVVTRRQSRLIAAERDAAVVAERRATANAAFLANAFMTADPRGGGHRNMTAFDLLQSGVAQLGADRTLDPRVRADLYLTLGLALSNLEQFEPGVAAIRRAVDGMERAYGRDSLETAEALHRLGDVLRRADRFDEAFAVLNEALTIRRRHLVGDTDDLADSYNNLAILAIQMGKYRESDDLQSASLAMYERMNDDPDGEAVSRNNLALLKVRQGLRTEALELATRAYATLAKGEDQGSTVWALGTLASIRRTMGQLREAEQMDRDALERSRSLFGPRTSRALKYESDLATLQYLQGHYDEAERVCDDLEPRIRRALGARSQLLGQIERLRGLLDRDLGRPASAERRLRAALADRLAATGPRHFSIPSLRRDLADVLIGRGQLSEAEQQLQDALAVLPDAKILPHVERARTLILLARVLTRTHRQAEAAAALQEARAIIEATAGENGPAFGVLLIEEARLRETTGDHSGSRPLLEQAAEILSRRLPARDPDRVAALSLLGR